MAPLLACGSVSLGCLFASVCSYTSPGENSHRSRYSRISSTITGEKIVYGGADWGILIQKSDSLWGAVLFHAAGDCLIIFGAYASM